MIIKKTYLYLNMSNKQNNTMKLFKVTLRHEMYNNKKVDFNFLVKSKNEILSLVPVGSVIEKVELITEDENEINNFQF